MATNDIFRKSVKYVGATISKQLMPDIGATISANKDYSDEIRSESKKIVSKLDESLFGGQINGVTNIFKNFKGSNGNNTNQGINKNTAKVGGVDTDFIESSLLSNSAMNKTNRRGFSTVAAVSTKVGSKQIQALGLIHNDLNKLVRFNTTHTAKMYDNMNNFFSETSKFYSQFFNHLQKEKVQEEKLRKIGEKAKLTEVFLMREYLNEVQENLNKTLNNNNKELIKNLSPKFMKDFSTEALGGVVSKALTKTFAGLGKTIANIPSMITMELGRWGEDSKNPLMKQLGKIFGVDLTKKGFDARKANREKAIFDNGTKKAIMTTIPSLLSKILNAIQSQNTFDPKKFNKGQDTELIYDYDKQNFSNRKKKKKETEKEYKVILDTYMGDYQREVMSMITKTISNPKMQQSMMNSVINSMGDIVNNPINAKAFAKGKLTSKMTSADENIISLLNSINQSKNSSAQANLYAQTGKVVKNTNNLMRSMEQDPYSGRSNAYDNTKNVKKSIIKGANRKTKGTVNIDPNEISYYQELDAVNETNKAALASNKSKNSRYGLKGKGVGLVQDIMNRPLEMLAKGVDTFVGKLTGFIMNDDELMNNGFLNWFKGLMNEKIFDPIKKNVLDPVTGWFKTKGNEIGVLVTEPIKEALKSFRDKYITPNLDMVKDIGKDTKTYLFGKKDETTGKNNKEGFFSKQFKFLTETVVNFKNTVFGKEKLDPNDFISSKNKELFGKLKIKAGFGVLSSIFLPGGPIMGAFMGLFTETKTFRNTMGKATADFKQYIFGKFDEKKGKFTKDGLFMDMAAKFNGYFEDTKVKMDHFLYGDEDSVNKFMKNGGLAGFVTAALDKIKGKAQSNEDGALKKTGGKVLGGAEKWAERWIVKPFNKRMDDIKGILMDHIAKPLKSIGNSLSLISREIFSKIGNALSDMVSGNTDSKKHPLLGFVGKWVLSPIAKLIGSAASFLTNMYAKFNILMKKISLLPLKLTASILKFAADKFVSDGVKAAAAKATERVNKTGSEWLDKRRKKREADKLSSAKKKLDPNGVVINDQLNKTNDILSQIRDLIRNVTGNNNSETNIKKDDSNFPKLIDGESAKDTGKYETKGERKSKFNLNKESSKATDNIKSSNTAEGQRQSRTIALKEKATSIYNKTMMKFSEITAKSTGGIYKAGSKVWKMILMILPVIGKAIGGLFKWFTGTKFAKALVRFGKGIWTSFKGSSAFKAISTGFKWFKGKFSSLFSTLLGWLKNNGIVKAISSNISLVLAAIKSSQLYQSASNLLGGFKNKITGSKAWTKLANSKAGKKTASLMSKVKGTKAGTQALQIADTTSDIAKLGTNAVKTSKLGTSVANVATKGSGLLSKATSAIGATKVGTKLLSGAAKIGTKAASSGVLKALGPLGLALGVGMDGMSGWNNAGQTFGLEEGQEATTGQKASSAVGSILTLGGLTDNIPILGDLLSSKNISKGIHGIGSTIGNVVGGVGKGIGNVVGGVGSTIGKGIGSIGKGIGSFFGFGGDDEKDEEKDGKGIKKDKNNSTTLTGSLLFDILKIFFTPRFSGDYSSALKSAKSSKDNANSNSINENPNLTKVNESGTETVTKDIENMNQINESQSTNDTFKESNTAMMSNNTQDTNNMGVGGASDTPNMQNSALSKPIGGVQQGFSNIGGAISGKKKSSNINSSAYSGGDSDASGIKTANKIGSGALKGGILGKTSGTLLKGSTRVSAVDMGFGKLNPASSNNSSEESSNNSSYSSSGGGKYKQMGQLAAKYESGGNPASISKAAGDAGGASYGVFQFSKNMGSLKSFLDWLKGENPKLHSLFEGKELGSNSFDDAWKKAAEDPEFEELQYKRIYETFFRTANSNFKDITGVDSESSSSLGLQNAIWSTGVQMGPNTSVFRNAGLKGKSTKDIISAIYDERGSGNGSKYFATSSGQIQASVANRFKKEKVDALALGGPNQSYVKNVITNDQSKLRSQQSRNNYGIGGGSDKDKKKYADANEFFLDKGIHNFTAVTSGYGEDRTLPNGTTDHHWGIDYGGAPEGSPIRTPAAGEIIKKERNDAWGMGNWVVIRDDNNNYHMFMHQQKLIENFKVGDKVKAGDQIGYVGNTGNSFGAHLHYQIDEGTISPLNGPHAMNPNGYKFPGDLVMGSMSKNGSSSSSDNKEGSDDSEIKFGYKDYLKIKQGSTGEGVSSALTTLMRGSYGGAIDDNLLKNKYNTPKYKNLMGTDYMAKAVTPRDKKFHVYNSGNIKPGFGKTNVGGAKNYIYGFGGASTSPSLVANNLNLNYESLSSTNRLLYAMYNVLVSIDGSAKGILDKELEVIVSTEGNKIHTSANNDKDDKDGNSVNIFTPIVNNMDSSNSNSSDNHSLSKKIKIIAQGD